MTIQEMYQEMEDQKEWDCEEFDDASQGVIVEIDYTTQS